VAHNLQLQAELLQQQFSEFKLNFLLFNADKVTLKYVTRKPKLYLYAFKRTILIKTVFKNYPDKKLIF